MSVFVTKGPVGTLVPEGALQEEDCPPQWKKEGSRRRGVTGRVPWGGGQAQAQVCITKQISPYHKKTYFWDCSVGLDFLIKIFDWHFLIIEFHKSHRCGFHTNLLFLQHVEIEPTPLHPILREGFKKNCLIVRLTVTVRGGESAPSVLTASKCENFDPFLYLNLICSYSKHILSHCEGSQKCIFNAFNASAIPLSDRFVTEQQRQ